MYTIQPKRINSIPVSVNNSRDTLIFKTDDATVFLYAKDSIRNNELQRLAPYLMSDIRMEKKDIKLQIREVKKDIKKENDNPVKNFFFIFGIIAFVLLVLFLVIKFAI